MHRMTKQTAIPQAVKRAVAERDSIDGCCCCVLCGSPNAQPNAHIVRRSQGGMGTERNIVSICPPCHRAFDEGENIGRLKAIGFTCQRDIEDYILNYIKSHYSDWTPESVTYTKWG